MPNMRFVPINLADVATLTVSSAALPAANMQDVGRSVVWRSTGKTAEAIYILLPSAMALDTVALIRSNLTGTAQWNVHFYSDAAWTTLLDESGGLTAVPSSPYTEFGWGYAGLGGDRSFPQQSVYWRPASTPNVRSIKIDLVDTANPEGYIEVSRLVVGKRWSPNNNFSYKAKLSFLDQGRQARSEDGTLRSDAGASSRRLAFNLDWMNDADRAYFGEIQRYCGLKRDLLASLYPGDATYFRLAQYTMLAKFVAPTQMSIESLARHSAPIEMEES